MNSEQHYHSYRAQVERDLADQARDSRASDAHMRLFALHLSRALILEEIDRRLGEPRRSMVRG